MSSSQFPNFNFATCVCLSDIWYKFIFLCICALAWNVLPYCQNARFGSCWLAGRLATSSAAQLPSTDCLPIIAPWPLLPSYDFPLKCFGMYKSAENQNGQLHFIRVPTIALSTDCSIQLPGVSSLSLFVFLFLDFPLFPSYPSLNCLSHVRCTAHRKGDFLPKQIPSLLLPPICALMERCHHKLLPPQCTFVPSMMEKWAAVLLNWKQILPLRACLRAPIHTIDHQSHVPNTLPNTMCPILCRHISVILAGDGWMRKSSILCKHFQMF